MIRAITSFFTAVVSAYVVAVLLVGQFNIARVVEMGFDVSLNDRFSTAGADLLGMLGTYLPLIAIAFLIAFIFTRYALLRFIKQPVVLFTLAGFVAVIALHSIMHMMLGLSGIAPTRTLLGLLSQGLAGAIGGYVYSRMRKVK